MIPSKMIDSIAFTSVNTRIDTLKIISSKKETLYGNSSYEDIRLNKTSDMLFRKNNYIKVYHLDGDIEHKFIG